MSIVFSALVGTVIVGFFFIALRDERVRQTIFSGTAGIQFVTLFSLVIAIILFGITGVLEGKELAALLGGLSGYILGRVTTESAAAPSAAPSPPPPTGGLQPAVAPQPQGPSALLPAPAPPPGA